MGTHSRKNWSPPINDDATYRVDLTSWASVTSEATTARRLLTNRTAATALRLVEEIHAGAQQAMDASPNQGKHACHKGCPGCCHSMISVTAPEACAIAEWLRDNKRPEEVAAIRQHASENAAKGASLNRTAYAESMLWCPLLDSQLSCTTYDVRPLTCRAWNSLSLDACHDCYFSNHVNKKIPLDDHTHAIGQGIRSGLSAGIKGMGLDGQHYELNSALIVALDEPDAADRWIRGDEVFEQCHSA